MTAKKVFELSLAMLAVALLVAGCGQQAREDHQFNGTSFEPFPEAYQFTLTDHNGQSFRLQDQRGKVVLLFFGYANCPDVCPNTLAELKKVRATLGDQAEQVVFVFITVDPERDSRENIGDYVSKFDPSFIGLTGTLEELAPVWEGYFVTRELGEAGENDHEDDLLGYEVGHSARVYVIDPEGNLHLLFSDGMDSSAMAQDVAYLLAE